MKNLEIHLFSCLDAKSAVTASIDAPDAGQVRDALTVKGWKLTHILTTHHHGDHTGGNLELKAETGCTIVGPRGEAAKIPGIDIQVGEGDHYQFGSFEVRVIETGGHTLGHITYWIPDAKVAFAGDTLFPMGCGRVFEGSMEQMWRSLEKLAMLPRDTRVYCGHEYTMSNAKFAMTIEPGNVALQERLREVEKLRAERKPTVPTRIDIELATNPFLRSTSAEIRERLGLLNAEPWQVFAEVRDRKNRG